MAKSKEETRWRKKHWECQSFKKLSIFVSCDTLHSQLNYIFYNFLKNKLKSEHVSALNGKKVTPEIFLFYAHTHASEWECIQLLTHMHTYRTLNDIVSHLFFESLISLKNGPSLCPDFSQLKSLDLSILSPRETDNSIGAAVRRLDWAAILFFL